MPTLFMYAELPISLFYTSLIHYRESPLELNMSHIPTKYVPPNTKARPAKSIPDERF